MPVACFSSSRQHHAGGEEGDLVEVVEQDGDHRVRAEDAHRPELRDCADANRQSVRNTCDCDRQRRFRERLAHALFYCQPEVSLTPCRQHDKHVINANPCQVKYALSKHSTIIINNVEQCSKTVSHKAYRHNKSKKNLEKPDNTCQFL